MNNSELEFITYCCIAMIIAISLLSIIHTQLRKKYNTLTSLSNYLEEQLDEQYHLEMKLKMKCEELKDDLKRAEREHYHWVKQLDKQIAAEEDAIDE